MYLAVITYKVVVASDRSREREFDAHPLLLDDFVEVAIPAEYLYAAGRQYLYDKKVVGSRKPQESVNSDLTPSC